MKLAIKMHGPRGLRLEARCWMLTMLQAIRGYYGEFQTRLR